MSEESNPQADQPKQQLTLHVIFYYFTLREVFLFFFFQCSSPRGPSFSGSISPSEGGMSLLPGT